MNICLRYSKAEEEALEILNDGFLKVFQKIEKHDTERSFVAWFKRLMINTAIDHYRRNKRFYHHDELEQIRYIGNEAEIVSDLLAEDIMKVIQTLPDILRVVFNMYVIEGYAHKEIAKTLKIAEGTSRAHLSTANKMLREKLKKQYQFRNV